MQLTAGFVTALIAAVASAKSIGLIAIRSGSSLQNSPVNLLNGDLVLGGGQQVSLDLGDDGSLTANGAPVLVASQGAQGNALYVGKAGDKPTGKFADSDDHLTYEGSEDFSAVFQVQQQVYNVVAGSTQAQGSSGILLHIVSGGNSSSATNGTGNATVTVTSGAVETATTIETLPCPKCTGKSTQAPGPAPTTGAPAPPPKGSSAPAQGSSAPSGTPAPAHSSGPAQVNGAAKIGGSAAAVVGAVALAFL